MAKIIKKDIVSYMKAQSGITSAQASDALDAALDYIRQRVAAGDKVSVLGFGSFAAETSAARDGINPATKEKIHIPAKKRPKFSPGKEFKDLVANG